MKDLVAHSSKRMVADVCRRPDVTSATAVFSSTLPVWLSVDSAVEGVVNVKHWLLISHDCVGGTVGGCCGADIFIRPT